MSAEEIVAHYRRTKSMRKTAKELGIGVVTVFNYVNKLGASYAVGPSRTLTLETLAEKPIARAIARLPQPIPKQFGDLLKKLQPEFNRSALEHYLDSLQSLVLESIHECGSLLDHPSVHLRDIYGRVIPVGMLAMYTLTIDRMTSVVTINATLNFGGKVTFRITPKALRDILQQPENAPQTTATSE